MSVMDASLQISFQIRQSAVCVFYGRKMMNLRKKIDILQEFVTANVGILPPLSPSTDQATSYAAVAARQHDAASLPERVIQEEVPFTPVRNGARQINKKKISYLSLLITVLKS